MISVKRLTHLNTSAKWIPIFMKFSIYSMRAPEFMFVGNVNKDRAHDNVYTTYGGILNYIFLHFQLQYISLPSYHYKQANLKFFTETR